MRELQRGRSVESAAAMAGMDEKSARKYRDLGKLPSEIKTGHAWRTRRDPFRDVWDDLRRMLELNPGLEAKTLFEDLQRRDPGRFADGQLRSLQRKIKVWRAQEGPPKEVYFPQVHHPGALCESDFTHMGSLGITIEGLPFEHLLYHFVLTYSNWEWGMVCFSESFESLSEGLQGALWKLGAVPCGHRTDQLTAAVRKPEHPEEFTDRYRALLHHYGLEGLKTQAASPHENGDVEQRNNRLKRAVDQSLMLRGGRDFQSRKDYEGFIVRLLGQLNCGRRERLSEEMKVMRALPPRRLESCKRMTVRVGPSSTVRAAHNVYSVDSRLIGEWVEVRLYMEHVEIWYAQRLQETIPRIRGEAKHRIQYRHIIDWLLRKPGAFENYRYREDLFPTSLFRMAYDALRKSDSQRSSREYLRILYLAARESESAVEAALAELLAGDAPLSFASVERMLKSDGKVESPLVVNVAEVDLHTYDALLEAKEACCGGN